MMMTPTGEMHARTLTIDSIIHPSTHTLSDMHLFSVTHMHTHTLTHTLTDMHLLSVTHMHTHMLTHTQV